MHSNLLLELRLRVFEEATTILADKSIPSKEMNNKIELLSREVIEAGVELWYINCLAYNLIPKTPEAEELLTKKLKEFVDDIMNRLNTDKFYEVQLLQKAYYEE